MNHYKNSGFTVVELMVVIAIVGILVAASAPGFRDTVERMSTSSQAKALLGSLTYARSEAIKRRGDVTVCGSADGSSCSASAWADGWIVFTDAGVAGSVDGADEVLRHHQGPDDGSTLTFPSAMLQYDSRGFGRNVPVSPPQRFLLCPASSNAANAQAVDIAITGRGSRVKDDLSC